MPEHTTGKPQDFRPIPDKEWAGHVGQIRVKQRDDGNEQWEVPFIIEGAEFAGRMLWDTVIFGLQQTEWKIDQFVAATMGPQEEGTKLNLKADNFENLPARVRSFTDEYNGEKKSKIKTWIAIKPEDDAKAKPADKPAETTTQPTSTTGKADRF